MQEEIGAFIRVHGHGTHPIGFPAKAAHPCGQPDCIMFDEFVSGVLRRLEERHIWVTGVGLGVCGNGNATTTR